MLFKNEDQSVFSTAQLKMGRGASGKLVTEVNRQMANSASHADLAVIDGSPGIGCPRDFIVKRRRYGLDRCRAVRIGYQRYGTVYRHRGKVQSPNGRFAS